jgi:hypothetical protein
MINNLFALLPHKKPTAVAEVLKEVAKLMGVYKHVRTPIGNVLEVRANFDDAITARDTKRLRAFAKSKGLHAEDISVRE